MLQRLLPPAVYPYLVVDLETTCWYDSERETLRYRQPEIIEIGSVITVNPWLSWRSYARPLVNTQLSRFCRDLTGTTQDNIDEARELPSVLIDWVKWMEPFAPLLFASWGDFDYNVIRREWVAHNLPGPMPFSIHVNLKRHFAQLYELEECGLHDACERLGLKFQGAQHEALNDAKMAAEVLRRMWEREEAGVG